MGKEIKGRITIALSTFYVIIISIFIANLVGITNLEFINCLEAHVCGWLVIAVLSVITVFNEEIRRF